jgi:hypothetical protein
VTASGGALPYSAGGVLPEPVPALQAVKLSDGTAYYPATVVQRFGARVLDALNQRPAWTPAGQWCRHCRRVH